MPHEFGSALKRCGWSAPHSRLGEIVCGLQVHPELSRCPEVLGKTQRAVRTNASLAAHQFIDPVLRNTNGARKLRLCEVHWFQKFMEQHFAGMGRNPRFGQHWSVLSMIINAPDIDAVPVLKTEDDAVLDVHADTPKAFEFST